MTRSRRKRTGRASRRERRDPAATREALLRAGSRLFAERGFDGVRVEALAGEAGVNKAMVSYHFGGKRGLYEAVLSSTFEELVPRVRALAASPRPAPERLRDFVALIAEVATVRRPDFPAMFLREALASGRLNAKALPHVLAVFAAGSSIIEGGVREGHFRRVDPVLTYLSLMGGLVFFFATAPVRRRGVAEGRVPRALAASPEGYVRHFQELLDRGLAAEGRGSGRS